MRQHKGSAFQASSPKLLIGLVFESALSFGSLKLKKLPRTIEKHQDHR
jgi:hypothetical protein